MYTPGNTSTQSAAARKNKATASCIFIDNPVGAGFSYTESPDGYPTNEYEVATDYYNALVTFLDYFPEYAGLPLNIIGESYAGHYTYSVGSYIHHHPHDSLNLKRVGCGDGLTDPARQMGHYADFALGFGLIDADQASKVESMQAELISAIDLEKWNEAHTLMSLICEYILLASGVPNEYNVSNYDPADIDITTTEVLMAKPEVRNALHAGDGNFAACSTVDQLYLWVDYFNSSTPQVVDLLEYGYQILVYTGNYDLILPSTGQVDWTWNLSWSGQQGFQDAKREVVRYENPDTGELETAMSWKKFENFNFVTVWGSGHMVPADQPAHARLMLDTFLASE